MKLLKSFFSSIFALVIVLSTNVACKGYDAEEPAKALTIHISRQNYANREVRAAYTNVEEDNIQTLTVVFVDANGNLVKYGAHHELTYKFDNGRGVKSLLCKLSLCFNYSGVPRGIAERFR